MYGTDMRLGAAAPTPHVATCPMRKRKMSSVSLCVVTLSVAVCCCQEAGYRHQQHGAVWRRAVDKTSATWSSAVWQWWWLARQLITPSVQITTLTDLFSIRLPWGCTVAHAWNRQMALYQYSWTCWTHCDTDKPPRWLMTFQCTAMGWRDKVQNVVNINIYICYLPLCQRKTLLANCVNITVHT